MARVLSEVNIDDNRVFSVKLVDTTTEKVMLQVSTKCLCN